MKYQGPLEQRQFDILQTLVKTPSWFTRGNPGHNETQILDVIEELLVQQSDANVHRVGPTERHKELLDPFKRKGVFAERGTVDNADFTLLLYAHIDTVYPDRWPGEWHNPLQLTPDGEKLRGLGAYDMKGGAMSIIDVFRETELPPGLCLQLALCHDEEMESWGALDLVRWLKETDRVPDLIVSPEISTLDKPNETDRPKKNVIANRIGHVKSLFELLVPQAHRFRSNALDAETELNYARNYLQASFDRDKRSHTFFGKRTEDFKFIEYMVPRARGFSNTTRGTFRMSYLNVPGHSVKDVLEWESERLREVGKIRNWTHRDATAVFTETPSETSYEPYSLKLQSGKEKMLLKSVADHYGAYKLRGGGSTSDANIFNAAFPESPCFDIGPVGGGAHGMEEWVSGQSVVDNIAWMRHLIGNAIPEYLEAQK